MSGIFSSPGSPQRSPYTEDEGSADMEGLDSTMPDVEDTIRSRKISRIPPARSTPPRRSHINGSPRMSSSIRAQSQLPINSPEEPYYRLNRNPNGVRDSIEKQSLFKPKHVLPRSSPASQRRENRRPPSEASSRVESVRRKSHYQSDIQSSPQSQHPSHDLPLFVQNDETLQYSTRDEIEGALDLAQGMLHSSPPATLRKRRRTDDPRTSTGSETYAPVAPMVAPLEDQQRSQEIEPDEHQTTGEFASDIAPTSRRRTEEVPVLDDQPIVDDGFDDYDDFDDDVSVDIAAAVPSDHEDVDRYDSGSGDDAHDDANDQFSPGQSNRATGRRTKPSPQKQRVRIAAPPRQQRSVSVGSESESDAETSREKRSGSRSNVRLRSTTPFEDAGQRTTRSGRPVMKPLDWWAGETVIWKNGEVDGVVRANSIEPERRVVNKKRNAHKKQTKRLKAGMDAIDERDEDLLPSDWEEEDGVLNCEVASWNPKLEAGDDSNIVSEGEYCMDTLTMLT